MFSRSHLFGPLFFLCALQHSLCQLPKAPPPLDFDIGSTFEEDKFLKHVQETLVEKNNELTNFTDSSPSNFNKTYQACTTPKGQEGHCKLVSSCKWEELSENPSNFVDYFCIIEGSVVGVCCPDIIPGTQEKPTARAAATPARPNIPQHADCGINGKLINTIRSPQRSEPMDWPWIAVMLRKIDYQNFCGGALINRRYVLTAAHCVHNKRESENLIRLGEYDFRTPGETDYVDFTIIQFIKHEDYDPANQRHDIALIKINRAAEYNRFIRPVCLPYTEALENETVAVAGWGMLYYGGPLSDVLMEVSMPIWNVNQCASRYSQPIFTTNLCAAAYDGGADSCQGDSGGPLLKQLPSGRWIIVGVVSWGISCGEKDAPGVYTRVESYLSWIAGRITDSKP